MNREDLVSPFNACMYKDGVCLPMKAELEAKVLELRKAQSQRADFSRQLAAEREHCMQLERIVDEVRARNRELEAAKDALVALAREVSERTSALVDDDVLAKALVDACDAIRKCSPPPAELKNATEHLIRL